MDNKIQITHCEITYHPNWIDNKNVCILHCKSALSRMNLFKNINYFFKKNGITVIEYKFILKKDFNEAEFRLSSNKKIDGKKDEFEFLNMI